MRTRPLHAGRRAEAAHERLAGQASPASADVPPAEVTGRDCSIQSAPSESNAHSVSCGAP